MPLTRRGSTEERAQAKLEQEVARQQAAFRDSPVGRARAAYERGDSLFQFGQSVMSQQAVIIAMVGSSTIKETSDPNEILNAVVDEGWELVNGSFVFVEEGQQSRDKFMSSGQNVAVKGRTMGYYLFRRADRD